MEMAKRNDNTKRRLLFAIAVSFIAVAVNILSYRQSARLQRLLETTGWTDMHTEALRNPLFFVTLFLPPTLCCICHRTWEDILSQQRTISEHTGTIVFPNLGLCTWDIAAFVRHRGPDWAEQTVSALSQYIPYITVLYFFTLLYRQTWDRRKSLFLTVCGQVIAISAWATLTYRWYPFPGLILSYAVLTLMSVGLAKTHNEKIQ